MHKVADVLNKIPKSMAPPVKSDLRDIAQAEAQAAAEAAMNTFAEKYGAKYAEAVACLTKDREALLACLTTSLPSIGTISDAGRGNAAPRGAPELGGRGPARQTDSVRTGCGLATTGGRTPGTRRLGRGHGPQ